MPSNIPHFIVHPARGGLDTQSAPGLVAPTGLIVAENIHYARDGGREKRGDQQHLNTSAMTGSTSTMGSYDFWRDDGGGDSRGVSLRES